MNKVYVVITAVGSDRVGIVDDISAVIEDAGLNIEESRMSVLGGEFAVIMLVSGQETAATEIKSTAASFSNELKLHIEIKDTVAPMHTVTGRPYSLESMSLDTPGIVHHVSRILHRFGINIEDLEAETLAAPWTGAPMFHMTAKVVIPPDITVNDVREALQELEDEHDLDISLSPWTGTV
jgi:glycine cleavage system transcriptional repressor